MNGEKKNKPDLSIITIVLNDKKGFLETLESVKEQDKDLFEYIVIDGKSTDGTLELIEKNSDFIDVIISEKDNGIYDAFNKGAKLAKGKSLLFLNAGDYFVGKVIDKNNFKFPTLFPVKFVDVFGRLSKYKQRHYKLSHPYNLHGIIFENKKITFDESYKIASDYDYYIQHGYKNLTINETEGYVLYDNNGISTIEYILKYKECAQIIYRHFGFIYWLQYRIRTYIKHLLKVVFKFLKII